MSPVPLKMEVKVRESTPISSPPEPEPEPDTRLSEVLDALRSLPSPAVVVEPPDLSAIVTAVTSLKPGPTAAEIAAAIADVLRPGVSEDSTAPLREVAEALKTLDFRMKGMGRQAYGGGAVDLTQSAIQQLAAAIGSGSGPGPGATDVTVHDPTATTQKLAIDSDGHIGVSNFPATQPVSGSVSVSNLPATQPVSGTFWQATQPVSGTVTVANPTTNPETGLAKDATLTGGTTKAINRGGAKGSTTAADVTSENVDANTQALHVNLKGTQASVPVTGTFWQATQPVSGTFWQATQPVSGTVTANAGTGPFPVSDNAGSLTIDAPVGTPAFVRLSDGSAAITNLAVNKTQLAGNAIAVDSGTSSTGTQRVILAGPASANILVGHQAFTATTGATTIITIPSNRTWVGQITVTCDVANVAAGTAVGQALGVITTTGANTVPAAGTVFSVEARIGAGATGGTVGSAGHNTGTINMVVATGAATGTLALTSTQAGTNSRVAATASGVLI